MVGELLRHSGTMLGSEAKSVRSASGPPTPAGALLRRAGTLLGGKAQTVRAAPLLTHLVLLWHYRQVDRIVGHRVSKGKTTVFMIDGSFPKKSFIGPK